MAQENRKDIDHPVAMVLLAGMIASIALMLIGLMLLIAHPGPHVAHVLPVGRAVTEALHLHASGWLSLGLFVLILTPVARVIMAGASFAWIRDWRFVCVSLIVLAAMLAGMVVEKH